MKTIVSTPKAPAAIGPYSQAVRLGNLLFVSGQIPMDPVGGGIVGDEIEAQSRQVLANLVAIIEAAGFTAADVVKCTCFLKDMEDFARFNAVYAEVFREAPPARECVQVARLPKDARVEVSAICAV
ncbi:MAG: RidA family protein, partial [Desulfobacteraceae bacterium]|jgi:2-iminobutanoate/2-iminopropanoate deaminase|nr:RidA family protein [Desulfobacteraceae bacterium]